MIFMKKIISMLIVLVMLFTVNSFVYADNNLESNIVSYNGNTGVTIYRDAAGGLVFSGLMVPFTATETEQANQKSKIAEYEHNYKIIDRSDSIKTTDEYVDYEHNPIYIGTWDEDAYARHTLGTYNEDLEYLTSYGYASWYNSDGNTALPYRNGATNNGADQGVVDVAKFSYFNIRDIGTDNATQLQITDWGPTQDQHPDRIADLDKYDFIDLHGNSSDGLFYSRTWVPINNYNP